VQKYEGKTREVNFRRQGIGNQLLTTMIVCARGKNSNASNATSWKKTSTP